MADKELRQDQAISHVRAAKALAARKPATVKRKPKPLPPYRVLLHNDDVKSFEHVIQCIVQLTQLRPQDALLKAIEAHQSGVSLLLVTHRERAELYVDQFISVKLTVSIEPVES